MTQDLANLLTVALIGIQTTFVIIAAIVAAINLRKFRDSRGVDFIITAESTIDPLRHDLVNAEVGTIKAIYRASHLLDDLSDEDCKCFPFMQSLYSHVSRMYYILSNTRLDLGLTAPERVELIKAWTSYLALFKEHPAMIKMHASAMRNRDFNEPFLKEAERVMKI